MTTHCEHLVNKMDGLDYYKSVTSLVDAGHDALPAVRAGMGHPNWRIRRGCAAVLIQVYDTESLQRLVLLTRDPKKKVRKMATLSLGLVRSTESANPIDVVPHLAYNALNDPAVRVRRIAVAMLGIQKPQRRIVRLLRKILATEQDPKAVQFAQWGLTRHQDVGARKS